MAIAKKSVAKPAPKPAMKRAASHLPHPATLVPAKPAATRPLAPVIPAAGMAKAAPAMPAKTPSIANGEKSVKPKKPKLIRDSFTIPKAEYQVLDELKKRAAQIANPAKKSELLRAGIKALAVMSDAALLSALQAVPAIKTGRPSQR